jgi:hypothetical protein
VQEAREGLGGVRYGGEGQGGCLQVGILGFLGFFFGKVFFTAVFFAAVFLALGLVLALVVSNAAVFRTLSEVFVLTAPPPPPSLTAPTAALLATNSGLVKPNESRPEPNSNSNSDPGGFRAGGGADVRSARRVLVWVLRLMRSRGKGKERARVDLGRTVARDETRCCSKESMSWVVTVTVLYYIHVTMRPIY